jgi:hypothetical protein
LILSVTIPPAFEYVAMVMDWFWPAVIGMASFGLGYICGGCAQRG